MVCLEGRRFHYFIINVIMYNTKSFFATKYKIIFTKAVEWCGVTDTSSENLHFKIIIIFCYNETTTVDTTNKISFALGLQEEYKK